ncbi:hypothetical protein BGZ52_004820, partial [Haplosporangium bisporale]
MVLISIPTVVSDSTGASTVYATCPDTQSTIILEFQGVIEMDGSTFAGNKLGLLSILDGGVKAQLVIGNHRLEGKVIKLDKAMLLIQKQKSLKDDKRVDATETRPVHFSLHTLPTHIYLITSNMTIDRKKDKLIIFDTTLRDGEQSPGVTLTVSEKIEIAKQLSRLGVDVLEAGFPVASQGDFDAVQRIATEVGPLMVGREAIGKPMVIAGLARAVPADIQRCFDAISNAPHRRIHTFLATSDIHLEHKLKITRDECVTRAVAAVSFAKTLVDDVEFSPEDAGRSDQNFLCKVLGAVIEAGATTLNIPDTVGYNMPEEYGAMIKYLRQNTKGSDKVIWSAHCHNDLGLATANTLSGIMNGIRQVEVTINGIGERAGNTAMEEIVMAVHTHPDFFPVYHTVNTPQFFRISQLVSSLSGMVVQPNKAIVGANAFLHESGIHQDGVLKNKTTYEIISPETVGANTVNLVLGKHSGRAAFRSRLQELGFGELTEAEFQ